MTQMRRIVQGGYLVLQLMICSVLTAGVATAQISSPNYRVEESFFGTGGELDASSTNYRAKQSAGELAVGNTTSTNYQANAGFNTTDVPFLELTVAGGTVDLGILAINTAATTTTTFNVRTYLASGYVVTVVGDPPTTTSAQTYTIPGMSSAAASSAGTEQFGLNLVANTNPTNFGANPVQVPDSTFSFGQAAAGYNTPNLFKYVNGDTIATSSKSSGQTTYTVSYILNIATTTPSGQYTTAQSFVVTSTF